MRQATNIDTALAKLRQKALALVSEKERDFVNSVVERAALTTEEALQVVADQRDDVLDAIGNGLAEFRALILRGGKETH
jgi:hypothetical protein